MTWPATAPGISPVSSGGTIYSSYMNNLVSNVNGLGNGLGANPGRAVCQGRLTLSTGVPVPDADVTGASTLYFTAFLGSLVGLFDGTATWNVLTYSSDISLTLSGLTSGKLYDVFLYASGSTIVMQLGPAWTNSSTRSTALVLQDGILVKSGDTTKRWIGTIQASGTTTTEDSKINRLVYNFLNQVPRQLLAQNNSSVTTTSSTWASVASTTATFLQGYTLGGVQYAGIVNAGSHSVSGTLSSFGAVLNGASTPPLYSSVNAPAATSDFGFTPNTMVDYSALGSNTVTAYAKTAASTLTLVNPGVTGWVSM